jgi:thioredoxin-related protein
MLFSAFSGFSQNREINFEHSTWKEILAKAKKENKLIMLDAFTSWCGPCKWMAKNIFTNDTVADFYNAKFVNAKIDMEKGEGVDIANHYAVQAYPTFMFIDGDGKLIHRVCGSMPGKAFIDVGNNAMNPEKNLAGLEKKFNADPGNMEIVKQYFQMMASGCMNVDDAVADYFGKQKESEFSNASNWKLLYNYVNEHTNLAFNYLLKHQEEFSKKYTKDSVDTKITRVMEQSLRTYAYKKTKKELDELKALVNTYLPGKAEKLNLSADMSYYAGKEDWVEYSKSSEQFIEKYAMNDANKLNLTAWKFYEHVSDPAMLEKAARWAKKSTELDDKYYNNDTYAALLFKLNKREEALKIAKKAIELGKKEGTDVKETEELLIKIESLK